MDRIQQFFFIWLELHLQQYITQISYTKEQTGSMLKQEEAENWALIGPPSGGGEEKKKSNNFGRTVSNWRWLGRDLAALTAQCVFIKQIFSHAVLRRSHTAQVSDPVRKLLNGLHLFVQVVCLNEVTHLKRHEKIKCTRERKCMLNHDSLFEIR